MEQCERITRMETILNAQTEQLARLDASLSWLESHQAEYAALCDYYSSEQYRQDLAADEAGRLPQNLPRGVLSEDGIWNCCADYRALALRMREVGLAMLKNDGE